MGLWTERVLPHLVEACCGNSEMDRYRLRALDGLGGTVLEIGFGSGLNAPLYPDDVTKVFAVEPSHTAREMALPRVAATHAVVEFVGLDGQAVPLPDASCDAALSTFTLCTIPDAGRALAEVRRVVRPGGTLHFLEHGLAPDDGVARWQRRLDGTQQRMAGGCHLTRDPLAMLGSAGLEVLGSESRYVRGPRPWTFFTWGRARNPGAAA
ncbi:MAG: class I SAM-dependent methyltransferase [Microthrixaceae bacterium]